MDHSQYLKIVEWSEEDQCYVGTCPGLMLGGIHGRNETKVYEELHKTLVVKALREGISLNSYCVHLLREPGSRYREKKTNADDA